MAFFVKWVARDGGAPQSSPAFNDRNGVMNFACDTLCALGEKPYELWIEDDGGNRILTEPTITLFSRSIGRLSRN